MSNKPVSKTSKTEKQRERTRLNKIKRCKKELLRNPNNTLVKLQLEKLEVGK